MAANSTPLNVVDLDFDVLRESLKTYLKNDPNSTFKDYDFDGSTLSILLDTLAYNTQLNAFMTNMLYAEAFLDSSQLRNSVLSHAKELNYLPRSSRSAKATITVTLTQASQDYLIIPKGTSFSATVNGDTFTYFTDQTQLFYFTNKNGNDYTFITTPIDIYEGQYITDSYTMTNDPDQRFFCSDVNIDVDSITVNSIEDNGATIVTYLSSPTLLGLDYKSQVYFIRAAETGKYEVVFGDGIIGRRPPPGSVITLQYRSSSADAGNGASVFIPDSDLTFDGSGRVQVTTVTNAQGGAQPESIESIKFNAPRHFQTQERAVTTSDYEQLMTEEFPEINAISVYGGEDLSPPQYGKVFVSIDIANVDGLPASKVTEYTNFLAPRMSIPIKPVFVAPTYLYWAPRVNVRYNLNLTTMKPNEVSTIVADAIVSFNQSYLNNFRKTLRYSKLVSMIDDVDQSIVSNETDVLIYKKLQPAVGVSQNFVVNFGLPLVNNVPPIAASHPAIDEHTVSSSPFIYNGDTVELEDDGVGTVRIVKTIGDQHILVKNVGSVDYAGGIVKINSLVFDGYAGESFKIYVTAADRDIAPSKSDIFTLETDEVIVQAEAIRE